MYVPLMWLFSMQDYAALELPHWENNASTVFVLILADSV